MITLAELLKGFAFLPDIPLVVAVCGPSGSVTAAASGFWPGNIAVTTDDLFYVASLAKQVTGVAAAVLVRAGRLDPDFPVTNYLSDLPNWGHLITSRHLLQHTSGLPTPGGEPNAEDWTSELALKLIGQASLLHDPGTEHVYSNIGYVVLAQVLTHAAESSFAEWTESHLFQPLGLKNMRFQITGLGAFPQAPLLGPGLPRTIGDGGLWATVVDFCRWLHCQNTDILGAEELVTAPARLRDGRTSDYGWGIGLRTHHGVPLLIHGGQWGGATAKAARCPSTGAAVCAFAEGLTMDDLSALVDSVLEQL